MIKNVHIFSNFATIQNTEVKKVLMQLESDLLRGLNTLLVLQVILNASEAGSYAYKINKSIQDFTHQIVSFEESTLYILLKGLERDKMVVSTVITEGRKTKIFKITPLGRLIYDYGIGFLTTTLKIFANNKIVTTEMLEQIFPHITSKALLCPNCSNRLPIESDINVRYCMVCGNYVEELIKETTIFQKKG